MKRSAYLAYYWIHKGSYSIPSAEMGRLKALSLFGNVSVSLHGFPAAGGCPTIKQCQPISQGLAASCRPCCPVGALMCETFGKQPQIFKWEVLVCGNVRLSKHGKVNLDVSVGTVLML